MQNARRSWALVSADHVFADAALSDVEAKFEPVRPDLGTTASTGRRVLPDRKSTVAQVGTGLRPAKPGESGCG